MENNLVHLKFNNQSNPKSGFDLVRIEDILGRTYQDHSPLELHKVGFYILLIITQGNGTHTVDFTDYTYKTGTVITIRKDQIHKFSIGKNSRGFLLLFKDDFLVSYLEKLEAQKSLQLFNEMLSEPKLQLSTAQFKTVSNLISDIQDEYNSTMDDYALGIIRSLLHILITKLFRIKSAQQKELSQVKYLSQFIAFQHLVEQQVAQNRQVIHYAQSMAISTKTLNTICKQIVHKTAKEFIDEICTKQIKRLLINTPLSVKEIAHRSGFNETTNFYKYFKRQLSLTPEQFRANH